jgi:hypothetical protein
LALFAEVPKAVVTHTSAVPIPGGLMAAISESLSTLMFGEFVVPKLTCVAPVKPLPVMMTIVPPAIGPLIGLSPSIPGGSPKMN